jgi:hypothetical protein
MRNNALNRGIIRYKVIMSCGVKYIKSWFTKLSR